MALKVIGAGLGRTGTLSLKFALEHLGFGPCYHMVEAMASMPTALPKWLDVIDGRPDWDAVFEGYAATVDHPGCQYWREIAAHFPDAKVILTVRDPESWFRSANATILSPGMLHMLDETPAKPFFDATVHGAFGDGIADADHMIDYFKRWNAAVIEAIPAERLLVFEAKQGWQPLCAFLGVPVPTIPYPRVNERREMQEGLEKMPDIGAAGPPSLEMMAEMGKMRLEMMRAAAFGSIAV
jgi:hypothetical protein